MDGTSKTRELQLLIQHQIRKKFQKAEFKRKEQARKLQDAQAEKLTSLQANKLTS